jgi:outer membrane receptor protein involved in Fe transport
MYGSNAFLGVLNIITKEPDEIIKEGKQVGISAIAGYGSFNTKFIDATFAAQDRKGNISFSITGRGYFSDEMDFSKYSAYAFKAREYNDSISAVYHKALDIKDSAKVATFLKDYAENHAYYNLNADYQIILTEEGIRKALELDNTVYEQNIPSDYTDNKSVYAKLKIYDLVLGVMAWEKHEGAGAQYNDREYFTANQGHSWAPLHNTMYAKYEKSISKKLILSNFISFKLHDFQEENKIVRFRDFRYSTGRKYKLANLLEEDIPRLDSTYFFQKSNQIRNELKILYIPNNKLDILAGFEVRYSVLQGDYNFNTTGNAEEEGTSSSSMPAGNHFFVRDLGVYAQSTYKIFSILKLTAGLRYDNNIIRESGGYGNVFNPRFAIVFFPHTFIFKVIYAEAFKDATNREKFSIVVGKRELTNPGLEPEKVKNLEASIGKTFFDESLYLNCVGYFARYSNIIQEVKVETVISGDTIITNQNQAVGQQEVYGINAFLMYKLKNFDIYANYTYTAPWVIDPVDSERQPVTDENGNVIERLRIGDISSHQANLGVNYLLKDFLNINIRTNYVGERLVGENTTVSTNLSKFPQYMLLNGAITYYNLKTGISIQLQVNNILNKEYYSPGLDQATNELSSMLPQNERNFHLKLMFEF